MRITFSITGEYPRQCTGRLDGFPLSRPGHWSDYRADCAEWRPAHSETALLVSGPFSLLGFMPAKFRAWAAY